MIRGLFQFASVIACAGAAWQPSAALAQDEDVQFWLIPSARTDIGEDTSLTFDASFRFREDARGGEQQVLRFTIDHSIADGVSIGGGGGVFEAGGNTELRPHQQLTIRSGRFTARTRLEERFFEGADRVEIRIRQRLGYSQPLGEAWSANVDGEWLYTLQSRRDGGPSRTDQWRFRGDVRHKVSDNLTLGAGYLAIISPRGSARDRLSHIPQATIALRF